MASPGTQANGPRGVALDHVSPARLFFALLKRRFSGAVGFDQAGQRRHVWFRGGMPLYTDWDSAADVLGEVLIGRGLVSPQMCEHGLAIKAKDGGYLGRILVGLGVFDEATLVAALSEQCARKVARIFALRSGTAWVDPDAPDSEDLCDTTQPVNVLALIRDGVATQYDLARVEHEMGSALAGSVVVTDAFARYRDHFRFRRRERVLFPELERGITVADLCERAGSRELALPMVYCLWACQMLRVGEGTSLVNVRPAGLASGSANNSSEPSTARRLFRTEESSGARRVAPAEEVSGARRVPTVEEFSGARRVAPAEESSGARRLLRSEESSPSRRLPGAAHSSGARRLARAEESSGARRLLGSEDPYESQLLDLETKVRTGAHAFALLGLDPEAERKEIRTAWAVLSRRFHPDLLEGEGRTYLRDRVQRVFAALSEAHSVLNNKEEREKLKQAIELNPETGGELDPNMVVRNALEAEMLARDADKLLKAGNFPRALEIYERSLELSPREAEVRACAAWCRFQMTARLRSDALVAIKVFEAALSEQPNCGRAHYYLGMARLSAGLENVALASFDAAYAADPKLIDAERQARAIRIKNKTKGKGGEKRGLGLRGLFGRKSE